MSVLTEHQIKHVYHFAPLHYLPFIARSKSLLSKPRLLGAGFAQTHFRSTSRKHDVERGFGAYVHLTLKSCPEILKAKLALGIPHVGVILPAELFVGVEFGLCRFNIAKTRTLRRNGHPGYSESSSNGRYYEGLQVPIAKTDADKKAMLQKCLPADTTIELLVRGKLNLPPQTSIVCFSDADLKKAHRVLLNVETPWTVTSVAPPSPYPLVCKHVEAVDIFIDRVLAEPSWRGDGLEFDR